MAEDVRLIVLCVDTIAEEAGADGEDRVALLRTGFLSSILPLQDVAKTRRDWCRVIWTLSSSALAGTVDPVRAAIEHAALGAMRNVTREFASHWSTAAVVLDSALPREEQEERLAAAASTLGDPATGFYTGQVMRLTAPSAPRKEEVRAHG